MKQFSYTITDPAGIHARPAGLLAQAARKYDAVCSISSKGKSARLTQLIQLMGMGVKQGDSVTVTVDGPDEEAAASGILAFMQANL
ncbi:MAG: HPr family phosphocarrier protein [Clostridia bacterium]|nr:HPr family phosphocarrier protein [Clostridia bacterium]